MFLANSELFDQLLAPRDGNLTTRLATVPDERARVRDAYAAVFGREPDAEELRACSAYLKGRSPEAGVKQLLWAMLTSAEFQVNH
jgi:plasmid stability protein